MDEREFLDLVMRYQDGVLSPDEQARLERELAADETKRKMFREAFVQGAVLREHFLREAVSSPRRTWRDRLRARSSPAAAMLMLGIFVGLVGGGVVAAVTKERLVVTTEELASLGDGGFEASEGPLSAGFPRRVGVWSGDGVEVVTTGATRGKHRARFVRADPDTATPQGRAIACDLFQLVDLHDSPRRRRDQDPALLELSAEFLDARAPNATPSVTFFCQIYLFRGDPTRMHETWPTRIAEAVSSGSASITTLGDGGRRSVTARCLAADDADYAVIQIAARPNLRGPMPPDLFVDDVRLTLKTRPSLPEQAVAR